MSANDGAKFTLKLEVLEIEETISLLEASVALKNKLFFHLRIPSIEAQKQFQFR